VRVALVVTGGLHPSGKREVIPLLLGLVERLARTHVVHAFALRHLDDARSYVLAGATIHDLGRPEGRWSQWRALQRALVANGPFDLVHGWWADPAGLTAALAARRLGFPCLVTCDSGEFVSLPAIDYGLQRHARGRSIVALACRLAARVHVTTQFMESLARAHGVEPVRIPIGIDVARWGGATPPEGPPWRVLQVASLNPVKDHATLLRAIAAVRRRLDVHLDVVGEDTLGGRLQRDAAALGVADVVRFHGFVPHGALPPLYHAAHLYAQSSLHEAGGASVLEAAAAGVPVVGTRAGYLADWAPDAAHVVAPADPEALARAIVDLIAAPDRRRALAAAAREFVVAHDLDRSTRDVSALYAAIIEEP
jgi:glycosyltransferase involved in cell wall biosynthesis